MIAFSIFYSDAPTGANSTMLTLKMEYTFPTMFNQAMTLINSPKSILRKFFALWTSTISKKESQKTSFSTNNKVSIPKK